MNTVLVLRAAGIGLVGLGAAVATYVVAASPSRTASRLGLRGLKRQKALRENASWSAIEPLVRWLGVRLSGAISDEQHAALDRQLYLAGDYLGLTPEEYVALSVLSGIGGLVAGVVAGWATGIGGVLALMVGPIGAALPYLQISDAAEVRMKQINRGLPYVIDLMALAMSAGQDFPGAVRQVVDKSSDPEDALVAEFALILQELGLGITRKAALQSFARRAPSEPVGEFVGAVIQAEDRGNPIASVLQIQASVSRVRRTVRAEENAAKAGVAMVGPLILLFLCIMILVMAPMLLQIQKEIS